MKKVGEYVVYRKDVCKIVEIKENYAKAIEENTYLRDLISKEEVENIIKEIPKIEVISCEDKQLESEYKTLLSSNDLKDYVKIIKTTYLRNKEREENKKKQSDKDHHYFELAEKYLYNEFSIVLNKTYEETKEYVINEVEALLK